MILWVCNSMPYALKTLPNCFSHSFHRFSKRFQPKKIFFISKKCKNDFGRLSKRLGFKFLARGRCHGFIIHHCIPCKCLPICFPAILNDFWCVLNKQKILLFKISSKKWRKTILKDFPGNGRQMFDQWTIPRVSNLLSNPYQTL